MEVAEEISETKEFKETTDSLEKRVSNSLGEPVITLRNIVTRQLEGHYDSGNNIYYLETGIISGKLRVSKDEFESFEINNGLVHLGHEQSYSHSSTFAIPVKRKLSSQNSLFIPLYFPIKTLKHSEEGKIGLGFMELSKAVRELYQMTYHEYPLLEDIVVFIGKNEINKFFEESGIPKNERKNYFSLLEEGEIEREIAIYDEKEKTKLADELIQEMSSAHIIGTQIKSIEKQVERITFSRVREQDGSYVESSDFKTESLYDDLSRAAGHLVENIERILKKGDEICIKELKTIDGRHIGFPATIHVDNYLSYTNKEISYLKAVVTRLTSYLSKARSKA